MIDKQNIEAIFKRTVEFYNSCIHSKENAFLEIEVGDSLSSIIPIKDSIKIIFQNENCINQDYIFEIKLILKNTSGDTIGSYLYVENDKGEPVDDFLSFTEIN